MKRLIFLIIFLYGCAVSPQYFDGETVTYEHGRGRMAINNVIEDAVKQCASVGKTMKLERTDCPFRCISTFSCVERE